MQPGRAWSPADEAPKPGRGGCQKVLLGKGQGSYRGGADAPMGADEGSAGGRASEREKGERPAG